MSVERESARSRWTAGADAVDGNPGAGGPGQVPAGRMHAVSDAGLIESRALCLTPVQLLDPAVWQWPDDADERWPLCWACLALTHLEGHDPWPTP
jgi:hypothetical protein